MGKQINLNTAWRFHLGDEPAADFMGYDDSACRVVTLPHDWSVEHPFDRRHASGTGYLPGGTAWYRKHFTLPEEAAERRSDRLDKLGDFILAFENFPLFYPVCNCAIQVWLALYLAMTALFRRRARLLILLVPSVVSVLICVAGPTFFHNGLRYALPVIFANPFLFSVCLQKMNPDNNS